MLTPTVISSVFAQAVADYDRTMSWRLPTKSLNQMRKNLLKDVSTTLDMTGVNRYIIICNKCH